VGSTNLVGLWFFALLGGFVNRSDSYSSAAAACTDMHLFGTRMTGLDPKIRSNGVVRVISPEGR
jgi:hypothetical protein